jgi:hypothetical protein
LDKPDVTIRATYQPKMAWPLSAALKLSVSGYGKIDAKAAEWVQSAVNPLYCEAR